ncbi:hypothetical protein HK104_001882, partial [Borealophlyctis nickersoniae]
IYYHTSRWYRLLVAPLFSLTLLYWQTTQTRVCLRYMSARQREVLITESLPSVVQDIQGGGGKVGVAGGKLTKKSIKEREKARKRARENLKVVGREFKPLDEPLVFAIQLRLRRRVIGVAFLGGLAVALLTCAIPENAWKR